MKARVIALVVAAVVALIGVGSVVLYAQGANGRAVAGAQPVAVYVSQKLVPSGTTLADAVKQGLLARTNVPAESKPLGALTEVSTSNQDLVAVTEIQPGEFILKARFGAQSTGDQAIQVPPGQVAVSAQLTDPAKVGSFVTPGSRIVIFDTHDAKATSGASAGATTGTETQVLLKDVLVIAVGNTSLTPAEDGAAPAANATSGLLVTVALPPEDATRLVHAIQTGRLYAGLRGTGAAIDPATTVTDSSLFAK